MNFILSKFLNSLIYICFILTLKSKNQNLNNKFAKIFISINNNIVLKKIKDINFGKILILLPHCLQFYDCKFRVTNDINNCKSCNKCIISYFKNLNNSKYIVRVATGGTLARKYIKEIRPNLIIAVACKRDLITGIKDAYPFLVYGVFNIINSEPCINTTVSTFDIEEILNKIN